MLCPRCLTPHARVCSLCARRMEMEVINSLNKLVGYPEGSDGILAPGGATCNYMGMLMARHKLFPDTKVVRNDV